MDFNKFDNAAAVLEKIIIPMDEIQAMSWLKIFSILVAYVFVRGIFLQLGLFFALNKLDFFLRKKIYSVPFKHGQLFSEIKSNFLTMIVDGFFLATILKTRVIAGSGSFLWGFAISFIWFEIWFYISHRALHHPKLYFIHQQHHVAKTVNPFTALSFSILERLILLVGGIGGVYLLSLRLPLSDSGIAFYFLINFLLNIFAHSNVELIPAAIVKSKIGRILNAPTYHSMHHARYQGNYGLFTPFLDQLFQTEFEDYEKVHAKVIEGVPMKSYSDKIRSEETVVVITGASSGIGEALAYEYAKKKNTVVLLARRLDRLTDVKQKVDSLGGVGYLIKCDVTSERETSNVIQELKQQFGKIDVLIANAGIGVYGKVENVNKNDIDRQFNTNIFGVLNILQPAIPLLKKTRGRIAILGSAYSYFTFPYLAPYVMSKYAIRGLAETLSFELSEDKVSTTLVCPGVIGTEFRSFDQSGLQRENFKEPMPKFLIVSSEQAAREIVRAVEKRKSEVVISFHAKFGIFVKNYFPNIYRWVISRFSNFIGKKVIEIMQTENSQSMSL